VPQVQIKIKGIDNKTPFYAVGNGYTTVQNNLRLYNGSPALAYGKFLLTSSALNSGAWIMGGTGWQDNTNSDLYMVVLAGSKIYTAPITTDTATLTFTDRTGAVTLTADTSVRTFAALNGVLAISSGSGATSKGDVLIKLTANTSNAANLGGTPPKGNCLITVNNYLFVGGQYNATATYGTVSWSDVNDPESWPAANSVDFRKNDGDRITALAAVGTDLIIFKNKCIGRLSTTGISISGTYTLGPLVTLSTKLGAMGPTSVDTMPDGTIVFLGNDGNLYNCDGNTIKKISETASPGPSYIDFLRLNQISSLPQAYVIVNPAYNEIRIKGTTTTSLNNGDYIYNYLDNYWYSDSTVFDVPLMVYPFLIGQRSVTTSTTAFKPQMVCMGTGDGKILSFDNPNYLYPSAYTGAGAVVNSSLTFTLSLRELGFIPRFLKAFFYNVTLPSNVACSFGWEGDTTGTSVSIPSGSYSGNRTIRWPIPLKHDAASYSPSFLTVIFSNALTATLPNAGFSLWISDEDSL
jgi:hypothetical protein